MSDLLCMDESVKPSICPLAVECEFGVECIDGMGGIDSTRRVTFKGYATDEVCAALVGAIDMVMTDESEETE